MLESAMPYYQSGLRNKLCYEITFHKYGKVINAVGQTPTPDASYKISNISLEYEIVTQPDFCKKYFGRIPKHGFAVRQSCQGHYCAS